MKKLTVILLVILMTAVCISRVAFKNDNKVQEDFNMDELLKISTYLLSEDLEGKGTWGLRQPR